MGVSIQNLDVTVGGYNTLNLEGRGPSERLVAVVERIVRRDTTIKLMCASVVLFEPDCSVTAQKNSTSPSMNLKSKIHVWIASMSLVHLLLFAVRGLFVVTVFLSWAIADWSCRMSPSN